MEKKKRFTKKTYSEKLKRKPKKVFLNDEELVIIEKSMSEQSYENFSDYVRNVLLEHGQTVLMAKPSDVLVQIGNVSRELVSLKKRLETNQDSQEFKDILENIQSTLKEALLKLYTSV